MATVAWFYLKPFQRVPVNTNTTNTNTGSNNTNVSNGDTANRNSSNNNSNGGNENLNDHSDAADAPAPTDEAVVLADLTKLEDEWTVANVKADKKTLTRILADDYVDTAVEARPRGKAEYLGTVQPDPTIEKWEFDELKLALKGDRATLSGLIRFTIRGQVVPARFVDKFVWRDGRWQAIGSEVTPLKEVGTAL